MTISLSGREISEKTLELNVCAEILSIFRTHLGFRKAIWCGLTQRQEREKGLDELLRNLGPGVHFMLQFKAPWPTSRVDTLYTFSINTEQHKTLEILSKKYPNSTFYVLPLFSTWAKADSRVPNLAGDTWLLKVADVDSAKWTSHKAHHTVRIDKSHSTFKQGPLATIHYPISGVTLYNAQEIERLTRDIVPRNQWIPSEFLRVWVREAFGLDELGRRKAIRYRGLNSIFVPT